MKCSISAESFTLKSCTIQNLHIYTCVEGKDRYLHDKVIKYPGHSIQSMKLCSQLN